MHNHKKTGSCQSKSLLEGSVCKAKKSGTKLQQILQSKLIQNALFLLFIALNS